MKAARVALALFIAAGLGVSAAVLHAGDAYQLGLANPSRSLYLRSGNLAKRIYLSFDALASDVYWMRAIQHYGRDRRSARLADRFELLYPLLDLTTSLDSRFNVAYRFGAVFLAEPPPSGPGRRDLAIALLEKGLRNNPERWQYAFDIGFIHYWYGADMATAAAWFDRAAAMPGAPIWIRPLAATTHAQGGDTQGARRLLEELAASEEDWIRRAATRSLNQLTAIETIDRLQRQLDEYVRAYRRTPSSWSDLDARIPAGASPVDPAGVPYEYDRDRQKIQLSESSPLYPLPRPPARGAAR